jgi:tetratricopeptide (TPR) repeat protein
LANEVLYQQARSLQREGKFDEAIETFQKVLSFPVKEENLNTQQQVIYTEALMQLMNTYQSKGAPEACVIALKEAFKTSPVLQNQCLRDYYSVLGYALSRTENMKEAEETMLKALTLPLNQATPERYFRDYAYAAAVFYSNPNYQNEVINWCEEALRQADLCEKTSGKQWVTTMLGALYKRNGHLNKALTLFQQSKEEAEGKGDKLGVLNSLHALIDLFLYWNVAEYANSYASEALCVENTMTTKNPMVSTQTYINKGWVMLQLGEIDSVSVYTERARQLCQSLPYNSGMVDVNLLHGTHLTELGGENL